jgi:soluble lytic murein transglycosylase-like protein
VDAGTRHGVDPELLAIVVLVESGGNPAARSGAGARGLMQVMPATAMDIAVRRGITGFAVDELSDPARNIDFGAWYLAEQLHAFGRADDPDWVVSISRAAAAYNGGPGSVQRWLNGGNLPAEAERYRGYVSGLWAERRAADSPALNRWLQAGGSRLVAAARAEMGG